MSLFPDEKDRQLIFNQIDYFRSQEPEVRKKLIGLEQNYDNSSDEESSEIKVFEPPETQRFCQYCHTSFPSLLEHVATELHRENVLKENWAFELIDKLSDELTHDDSWDLDQPSWQFSLNFDVGESD